MKLSGNTILITGGTSGIGWELGKTLLEKGNEVILMGRNKKKLEEARESGFQTITCDLKNHLEIESAVLAVEQNHPNLNVLINNAGIQQNYPFVESATSFQKMHQEVQVNFTSQAWLTQLLIPLLSAHNESFIINTTSGLGAFPKSDGLIYSASKAAMRNFTTGLRYALKDSSITVMEFIPPVTETPMTAGRDTAKMNAKELAQAILPQMESDRKVLTIRKMRLFILIGFLLPNLAHKILEK